MNKVLTIVFLFSNLCDLTGDDRAFRTQTPLFAVAKGEGEGIRRLIG